MSKDKKLPANYDAQKEYSIEEAAALLPQLSTSKFVGSVDVDILLTVSGKRKKESMSGSISFPHSFGESKKIIVFADEKNAAAAKKAGATEAGLDDLIKKVEDGKVEYDVVIAMPDVMAKIAKLGKVLGPKGLMPGPATGTVTTDVAAVVKDYMGGKQNFKMTEQGAVRARVAKLDMQPEQIAENITAFLTEVLAAARKFGQQPFKKITLSPTMGAGVKLDTAQVVEQVA